MKNLNKFIMSLTFVLFSASSFSVVYLIDGNGGDIGNVSIVNGVPITSNASTITQYATLNGQQVNNYVIIRNVNMNGKAINVPGWTLRFLGNNSLSNCAISALNLINGIN